MCLKSWHSYTPTLFPRLEIIEWHIGSKFGIYWKVEGSNPAPFNSQPREQQLSGLKLFGHFNNCKNNVWGAAKKIAQNHQKAISM